MDNEKEATTGLQTLPNSHKLDQMGIHLRQRQVSGKSSKVSKRPDSALTGGVKGTWVSNWVLQLRSHKSIIFPFGTDLGVHITDSNRVQAVVRR